ncbi:MAG: hypothetical protein E7560_00375 [Ruminococcaceae bacterium]|nr:hypothetical protein [Oscillospiraceae bacterium]
MNNNSMSFIKGLGAGMIAGATALAVGKVMLKDHKNISKGSTKLIKSVGDFVDGVQTMFK